jgi:phage baseplate assembly protein W
MPLVKPTLEAGILSLLTDLSARTEDPEQARKDYASQLATLIDTYVKSATVTVTTAGTAAAQSGFGVIT